MASAFSRIFQCSDAPLLHYNARPLGVTVDTIVIHSMYAPSHRDPFDPLACVALLDAHRVASHYLIARDGAIYRLVEEDQRAWHAGESRLPFSDDSRDIVNDFSIGIELVTDPLTPFSDTQYASLTELTIDILSRHKIQCIVGHDQIAPDRKTDPGPLFDWNRYLSSLPVGVRH